MLWEKEGEENLFSHFQQGEVKQLIFDCICP